ncbi:LptF/LptG family permease [Deinococcus budaensis]|uniref:Lipopolysaccharide export system permease protein n=1 Tax=Deinococcus budaensis TaxID=1665626 RepID=A0A7W8LNS2_9DEIO|nr:LptF/LptG family permease [Deinococcus budaensis]MBB5232867.1 lipopolysaccharide export system permease protein [Deinococcus budaensis]
MTRLTRYVTRELWPPLLAGTLLFTAILSFGYFFISSQYLRGVPLGLVGQWIAYQVPDTLVKVLPMAAVLMTVVAFGRLATERELVAVQAGGIGLGQVARPVVAVAAGVTALALWLSLWVAPRANVETRSLYWDVLTGSGLGRLVGQTLDLRGGLTLSLAGYDHETRRMSGVRVERWQQDDIRRGTVIFAQQGTFEDNRLSLTGYQVFSVNYAAAAELTRVPENDPAAFRAAVNEVFPSVVLPEDPGAALNLDTGLSRQETFAQYADAIGADSQGWPELIATLGDPGAPAQERQDARLNLNRKLALPFGNLVLALAALPFALRYGRTLGVSLGIALMIAVAYYLVFFVGLTLAGSFPALPEPGVWLANVAFALAALWLLRRT